MKKIVKKATHRSFNATKKIVKSNPYLHGKAKELKNKLAPNFAPTQCCGHHYMFHDFWPTIPSYKKEVLESSDFKLSPLISVILPTYNTDPYYLKECLESVLAQSYPNWELCIADDASTDPKVAEVLEEYSQEYKNIHYTVRKNNGHISEASNSAITLAKGEYIALLDHDDILWPNALFEVVKRINKKPNADLIYSDEDKIDSTGKIHAGPFFKPDWSPEFLESVNYITHFAVLKKTAVDSIGGFRKGLEGAQDWDLFLRVTEKSQNIEHIPKLLYSWRIHEESTASGTSAKPYVVAAQKRALEDHLKRQKKTGIVAPGIINDYWEISYSTPTKDPKISIVIPSKNQLKVLDNCLKSIFNKTSYPNYEVVVVDTGSDQDGIDALYQKYSDKYSNFKKVDFPEQPFSYSRSCNFGAKNASGQYLVMLNNDTEVLQSDWLGVLLSDASRKGVGAVGVNLLYPDGLTIQHAGIGIGIGGIAANLLSTADTTKDMVGARHIYGYCRRNVSAVTAACLMIKADTFNSIGGFDENLRITYNDVDLGLRLHMAGLRNIYTPHVRLLHHESISVGLPEQSAKRDTREIDRSTKFFKEKWGAYINADPYYNPNFTRQTASFDVW